MWTDSKGRRQNEECRIGENVESGILANGLGCRGLRQLRRYREIRQILESEGETTAPPKAFGATGRARLLPSPIRSAPSLFRGHLSWADEERGLAVREFRYQFKFLTVRDLISGWAVTTCDFNDPCGSDGQGDRLPNHQIEAKAR